MRDKSDTMETCTLLEVSEFPFLRISFSRKGYLVDISFLHVFEHAEIFRHTPKWTPPNLDLKRKYFRECL